MKKILSKNIMAVALSLTVLLGMLAVGLPAGAADTYEVTVGFDPSMVNDNGTVYLPLTTEDGKAIMDTYGDWTTAFGTVYVDGAEWPGTGYSITGNYFYMGGLGMNNISKIEIKAGTELTPDASCKSSMPIVIKNDLTLVKTDGVWAEQKPVAADVYEVTVGFDPSMVNDNGTVYLPVTTEDGKAIMDTYGDWTTAFGTVYVDGAEWTGTGYSITGNYFYMGGLGMNSISKIEIKAGTELTPDSACKSTMPIVIKNDLTLVKTDGVWAAQVVEEEKPTVTLGLMNAGADGTWELTVDDISGFTAQYYCVEATVDGVPGRIAMEKSGDHLVIWPSFFAIGGINAAPAQSFVIAEGAVLEPVDPNTTGWGVAIDGTQFAAAKAFSAVNNNGVWAEQVVEEEKPTVTLGLMNAGADGTWELTVDDISGFTAQYYCVEATVDGVTGRIAMEKSGDHLVIWPSFFAIGGISAAPAQSFVIAEGAVLEPVDPNTTGWGVAIDGPQFALTTAFSAVNKNGVWTEQAIEEEKPKVTLGYMNAGVDGTWELTVDDISGFTAQYYCVAVTVDGVSGRIAVEKSGDHLVIWPSFFTIAGGVSGIPAENFTIAEGAVLEPVDPNTTGWGVAIDGPQFAVATAFSFTNYNGTWSDKPIVEPIDVELTFDNVNQNNDWAFTYTTNGELPAAGQWYTTTATVDGVERTVLVEYFAPASLFYIYNHCFAATPGGAAYPAASLTLAEGAILAPISTPDASAVIVGGQTLKLTKEIDVALENGAWKDKNDIVPIDVELTFNNINQNNDWAFSANANALPTANQWFAVPVKLDGTDRTILVEYDVNASWFYVYHHCFWPTPNDNSALLPQNSLFIPAGTVLTPITMPDASAVNKKGQTYQLAADLDMAFENGAWVDKNVLPPVTPLDMELTFATVNSKNDWAFTGVADGIPTVNQWYTTTATVDGNDVTVLMEYDVNSTYFYIYYHCFSATPGTEAYPRASLQLAAGAILTPISAPDASAVIAGGQTYQLTAAVNVALEDGVWTDQNAAPPVVITPLDTVLTFANVNQNNDWAFTGAVSGVLPTANQWYMASVKLDGTDRIVLMEYDVNASLFYIYHHCFWNIPNADPALLPQSSLTIPADTLLVPVFTPDATAVIKGGQTLKLTKAVNVVLSEGDWIDDDLPKPVYNDLTVDKIAVSMSADQPASLRSYLLLSVVDPLPQAGAEWWNNYDVFNLTVLVDGTPYTAAIGGGGDASTLALYLMWTAVDEQVLANANEIVIKAGSKGRVGLEGITFASDLRIYKENGGWKTDYSPAEDVDLSNAVSVGVAFDHIDGANRLYLSALMSDASKIMDTYGDWTTVFGGIRMGILNADGTYTWVEEGNMPWSVTGTYFYMSSLQLHLYDAVEIKKGTVLVPDATCKSQNPIVIANDFRMVRDEWEEWVVDGEFTDKPDYSVKPDVPGSSNTGDTTKSPIAWIIIGICAVALVLCLVLSGKKSRR